MDPGSLHSYDRFMWENLFAELDIPRANVHIPRGDLPRDEAEVAVRRYEEAIRAAGGIDLQLLGIGRTGHIGFNEPGSGAESRTRLVTLDLVTRQDAAADFFGEENVPREAVTMGVATILEAREIVILATGEHKADDRPPGGRGRGRLRGRGDVPAAPSQHHVLHRSRRRRRPHPRGHALAARRGRVDARARRSGRWCGSRTGRRRRSSSSPSATTPSTGCRRSWRGTARRARSTASSSTRSAPRFADARSCRADQRVICFSPHPDDDVISMGGILRKLVENENEITVAYMTSGNMAVFDHDVRRHLDFLRRLAAERHLDAEAVGDPGAAGGRVPGVEDAGRRRHPRGAGHQAHHPGDRGRRRHPHPRSRGRRRALPQSAVLPDGHGAEGSGRPRRCRDRARAARGAGARPGLRGRRPLGPARHAPDVQGGDRARPGRVRRGRAGGGPRCGSIGVPGRSGR